MSFITDVAQWFEYLDRPSAQQFLSMFNKQRWKDECIAFSDMEQSFIDLINVLGQPVLKFTDDAIYPVVFNHIINAGYFVEWIMIVPLADCVVTLNDGYGNLTDIDVTALNGEFISVNYNAVQDRKISIEPIPVGTIIYVKKYKLP